jgi:hypothetical protein
MRSFVAVVAIGVLAAAACGDDGPADKADQKPATTVGAAVAETVVTVGESVVGSTVATTTATTQPPPATTVTVPVGLPNDLGIPGGANLSLGPSSSLSKSITVRGVPVEEVVAYVRDALAAIGWTVNPDLTFFGPGAVGQATVGQVGDDVEIHIVITGPP